MDNGLMVIGAAKEICSAVNTFVSTFLKTGIINKAQMKYASIKIEEYLGMQRSDAITAVIQHNIQNIYSTLHLVKKLNEDTPADAITSKYIIRQLDMQSAALEQVVNHMQKQLGIK